MGRFRHLLLLILFIFINHTASSQVGCIRPNGNLYTYADGTTNGGFPNYFWNGNVSDPNRVTGGGSFLCIRSYTPVRSCWVKFSCNVFGCNYDAGELVMYSTLPCPIDGFVWLLTLPLAGLGIHHLRKRFLLFP